MKGNLKFPDGEIYKKSQFPCSADMVTYSDTTVADFLSTYDLQAVARAEFADNAEKAEKDSDGNVISETYLTLSNAEMTGTPTAPTFEGTDTSVNQIATCGYFNGLVREVAGNVDSDMTLAKLITSINKDPNFATNMAVQAGNKQNKNSTLEKFSDLSLSENKIIYAQDSDTLTTTPITTLGKKILAASDLTNFRYWIGATAAEEFYDEAEKFSWQKVGSPSISSTNSKFGGKALQVSSGNYIKTTIPLGGQDFTIAYWSFLVQSPSIDVTLVNVVGTTRFGEGFYNDGAGRYRKPYCGSNFPAIRNWDGNALCHVEFCYKHSTGKLYAFKNGELITTFSQSFSRENRTIYLGNSATGTIDEFRILDGVCEYTSGFSVPTAEYSLTDKTVSLIHF